MIEAIAMVLVPAFTFFFGVFVGHVYTKNKKTDGLFIVDDTDQEYGRRITIDLHEHIDRMIEKREATLMVFHKETD